MLIGTSRILGGVGALLMFIGIIPYINYYGVIELAGLILVMVALSIWLAIIGKEAFSIMHFTD